VFGGLQIAMLEDMMADRAADPAEKRTKQTTGGDSRTSQTAAASNNSLSNTLK